MQRRTVASEQDKRRQIVPFTRNTLDDDGRRLLAEMLTQAQEPEALEASVVTEIASILQEQSSDRRAAALCRPLSATERSASMWGSYGDCHRVLPWATPWTASLLTIQLTVRARARTVSDVV